MSVFTGLVQTYRLEKNIYDVDTVYKSLAQGIYDSFKTPEKLSRINEAFATLKMIEEVCEPLPVEEAKIQINTIPQMI